MKVRKINRAGTASAKPSDRLALTHDERQIRRKLLTTTGGLDILFDLPQSVALNDGDIVELENGTLIGVVAEPEALIEITAKSRQHLQELCWHLGNRHLPTQIFEDHLLIRNDHVIQKMLEGLGATMKEVQAPFSPVRGAYHTHSHGSANGHAHG